MNIGARYPIFLKHYRPARFDADSEAATELDLAAIFNHRQACCEPLFGLLCRL